jgi:transposase-like protein
MSRVSSVTAATGTASAPTHGLERFHGEIKRRTNAVGAFPDRGSALRLITAVALNGTAIWTDRRYLDMFLLKSKEVAVATAA